MLTEKANPIPFDNECSGKSPLPEVRHCIHSARRRKGSHQRILAWISSSDMCGNKPPLRWHYPLPSGEGLRQLVTMSAAAKRQIRPQDASHELSTCRSDIIAVARLVQFVVIFNLMKEIDHRRADLNLLVVFQKLLVERHVGRAAKRLGLTQSAASHALGQLRIMFGDPLFVRHPKGIEPTSRAHALAPIVVDILDRANSMLASPGWFDPSKPHTFTIGGTDLAVFTVLVPLIKPYVRRHQK